MLADAPKFLHRTRTPVSLRRSSYVVVATAIFDSLTMIPLSYKGGSSRIKLNDLAYADEAGSAADGPLLLSRWTTSKGANREEERPASSPSLFLWMCISD